MDNWGTVFESPSPANRDLKPRKARGVSKEHSSSTSATVSTRSTVGSMKSSTSNSSGGRPQRYSNEGEFGPDYEEPAFPDEEFENRTPPPQRTRPRRRASIGVVSGPSSNRDREGPSSADREQRRSGGRHRRGTSRGHSGSGSGSGQSHRRTGSSTSAPRDDDFARGVRATKSGTGGGRPDGKSPNQGGRRVRNTGRRSSIGVHQGDLAGTSHSAPSHDDFLDGEAAGPPPQLFATKSNGRRQHQSRRLSRRHSPTGKSSAMDESQNSSYGNAFNNDWNSSAAFESDFHQEDIFGTSSGSAPFNRRGSTGIVRTSSPPERDFARPTRSRSGRVNLDELRNGAFQVDQPRPAPSKTTNIILPTKEGPKGSPPPSQGRQRTNRRASIGGFVNNLGGAVGAVGDAVTGGIGGAVGVVGGAVGGAVGGLSGGERVTKTHSSLDDDDDDARKKRGFFKDRKESKALPNMSRPQIRRSNSEDSLMINAKLNVDRRRHGTLLKRFEASGKTKLSSGERSNYSDRVMMGHESRTSNFDF